MILVSACLLNHPVRYKGDGNPCQLLLDAVAKGHGEELLPFCPEVAGGLATPRSPAEIQGGTGADVLQGTASVMNKIGEDATLAFVEGAQKCAALCQEKGITVAILKQRSPSCGSKAIYDGTFSGKTIYGQGVTAALLTSVGVRVYGEEDLTPELLEKLL
ncbi:MAG: DUF523 domain-containing protein [Phascolarctobacterium sp.]